MVKSIKSKKQIKASTKGKYDTLWLFPPAYLTVGDFKSLNIAGKKTAIITGMFYTLIAFLFFMALPILLTAMMLHGFFLDDSISLVIKTVVPLFFTVVWVALIHIMFVNISGLKWSIKKIHN